MKPDNITTEMINALDEYRIEKGTTLLMPIYDIGYTPSDANVSLLQSWKNEEPKQKLACITSQRFKETSHKWLDLQYKQKYKDNVVL